LTTATKSVLHKLRHARPRVGGSAPRPGRGRCRRPGHLRRLRLIEGRSRARFGAEMPVPGRLPVIAPTPGRHRGVDNIWPRDIDVAAATIFGKAPDSIASARSRRWKSGSTPAASCTSSHTKECTPATGFQWNFTSAVTPAALTRRNVWTPTPSMVRNERGMPRSDIAHMTWWVASVCRTRSPRGCRGRSAPAGSPGRDAVCRRG
jgi:hypothetical protein